MKKKQEKNKKEKNRLLRSLGFRVHTATARVVMTARLRVTFDKPPT